MIAAPRLSYAALISRDIPAADRLLGEVLGLPRVLLEAGDGMVPVFAAGQAALALFAPGDAFVDGATRTGVHHIGLDYGDAPPPAGPVRPGLGGGVRQAIGEPAGVRTFLASVLDIPRGGGIVERIDHIGIASADNRAAIAVFSGELGLPVESQQTDIEVETAIESFTSDKYGVVYHSRTPRPVGGLRVAFLTAGDCELEFLQNFDPSHDAALNDGAALNHGAAGNTRQDQGAITRFVAAYGAGLHHVALKTPDIDAALTAMQRAGARMIDRTGRPGSRRARIGFVHPAAFGGVLFHFVERD